MNCHTPVFSFSEDRTTAERDAFLSEVRNICLDSDLTSQVETRPHLPLPNDAYAQASRTSAIVQIFCQDLDTVEKMSGYDKLVKFQHDQQQKP